MHQLSLTALRSNQCFVQTLVKFNAWQMLESLWWQHSPVRGDVHDVCVAVQNLFDAVPMMHIPVQDEDLQLKAQKMISSW